MSSLLTGGASTLGNCTEEDGVRLRFSKAKELSLLRYDGGVPLGVIDTEKTSSLYREREVSVLRKQPLGCVMVPAEKNIELHFNSKSFLFEFSRRFHVSIYHGIILVIFWGGKLHDKTMTLVSCHVICVNPSTIQHIL